MAKKKRGDAHGGGHGWFVTFADLMGLMMSFFVMLVAFSTMDNTSSRSSPVRCATRSAWQTQARYSGIVESDGLPTRPKLKEYRSYRTGRFVGDADARRQGPQPDQRRQTRDRS